jgi:hypothetical protein
MSGCSSTIFYPPLIRSLGRRYGKQFQIFLSLICSQTCELIGFISNRDHSPIHILNNDVLLNIFHLYRLDDPDEIEDENDMLNFNWSRRHSSCQWWYKLSHVCRLWRNIILESPSWLDLHLLCTFGVPVVDMLAHSPPLPLTIDYPKTPIQKITAEDESGILLALSHRDRIRRIDLRNLPNMEKFVTVMDGQFPILERMYISSYPKAPVVLPETFQAPNLRHLELSATSLPIGSPLLTTTAAGLVTLELIDTPASAYFPPSYILTRLSLMPQLERLTIEFDSDRDVERQSRQIPDTIILSNLCRFVFGGTATYLEGLVACISVPSLSILHLNLSSQLPFTVPRLCQFIQSSENLTFRAVQVTFGVLAFCLHAVPWKRDNPLTLYIAPGDFDRQVASAVQFFGTLSPVLSVVEQVVFSSYRPSAWNNNVDRSQWRELFRPFSNAKILYLQGHLISRSLQSDDEESPLNVLPNLKEIGYSGGSDARDAFITFLNERQVAGHPVSLRLVDRSMFDIPGK